MSVDVRTCSLACSSSAASSRRAMGAEGVRSSPCPLISIGPRIRIRSGRGPCDWFEPVVSWPLLSG